MIPAGTSINITANFAGGLEDLAEGTNIKVDSLTIGSYEQHGDKGIFVLKGDSVVAALKRVHISRGGKVTIGSFSLAGTAQTMGGAISLLKLIFLDKSTKTLAPTGLRKYVQSKIEPVLTKAVIEFVLLNRNAIPGVDLADVLGISGSKKGDK